MLGRVVIAVSVLTLEFAVVNAPSANGGSASRDAAGSRAPARLAKLDRRLSRSFAVFRRARSREDALPRGARLPSRFGLERSLSRRVGPTLAGNTRFFVVPGKQTVCLADYFAASGMEGGGWSCASIRVALKGLLFAEEACFDTFPKDVARIESLLPDGATRIAVVSHNGTRSPVSYRDNFFVKDIRVRTPDELPEFIVCRSQHGKHRVDIGFDPSGPPPCG